MWRMPRRTAQTVRWSSVVPGDGSQLAMAAHETVCSPTDTAPTSARTPASVPVLFQIRVGPCGGITCQEAHELAQLAGRPGGEGRRVIGATDVADPVVQRSGAQAE